MGPLFRALKVPFRQHFHGGGTAKKRLSERDIIIEPALALPSLRIAILTAALSGSVDSVGGGGLSPVQQGDHRLHHNAAVRPKGTRSGRPPPTACLPDIVLRPQVKIRKLSYRYGPSPSSVSQVQLH